MTRSRVVLVLLVLAGTAVCRDAPELFDPEDPTPPLGPGPYQLTHDPARDVTPTWSAGGDSVLYLVERARVSPSDVTDTLGVTRIAYSVPADGGTARRLYPTVQALDVGSVSFLHVAQAPDGLLAAFVLGPTAGPICPGAVAFCTDAVGLPPVLQSAEIRIREPGSTAPSEDDPGIRIAYDGREFDTSVNPLGLDGLHRVRNHPFQQLFSDEQRVSSRISWSPDGEELAFSNGLELVRWQRSSGDLLSIPGSEDGLNPAWSPAGDWLAYERLERGQMRQITCEHRVEGLPTCVEERTTWTVPSRTLAIVRPDGSTVRLLLDAERGANPAWSPDGETIYFERDGRIWSIGLDGLDAETVAGTADGHEPSVSPDGTRLAFTRSDPDTGRADIWIVDLP